MFSSQRRFHMERLEERQMMAGDVAASMSGGDLYLDEAAGQAGQQNAVWISQLPDGKIRVESNLAADGDLSLVNGQNFQDFTVPGSLFITFGDGQDLVVFGGGSAQPMFQDVHIDVGHTSAVGNSDDDDVILWGGVARGSMFITTGAGNDWVYVEHIQVGDGIGIDDLVIHTGAGADGIDVKHSPMLGGNLDIRTFDWLIEADNDRVRVESVAVDEDLLIRTGGGNDDVTVDNAVAWDDIDINTGTGNDTASIRSTMAVDDFMARLGSGNDSLTLDHIYADDLSLLGEGGTDSLNTTPANLHYNTTTQSEWEWINGRRMLRFRLADLVLSGNALVRTF